ncbi:MAG: hypothetical protein JWQ38_1032 [Flavipsychrobacter sp.]|nr:hypothetical protein [Flavipsychrobacter sp.]
MNIRSKKIFSTLIFTLSILLKANAQTADNYNIQANIIYRFTKYVDWPQSKKAGDFIIGIIGESPLYDELKLYTAQKKVGDQRIIVNNYSSEAGSYNCHILIITENASGRLKRIALVTEGKPILIVSENNGLIRKGACINFIIVDDHLKLEFNKSNIDQRGLKIASELLNLGTVIK